MTTKTLPNMLPIQDIIIDTLMPVSYTYPIKKGVMKLDMSRSSKNSLHRKHGIKKTVITSKHSPALHDFMEMLMKYDVGLLLSTINSLGRGTTS